MAKKRFSLKVGGVRTLQVELVHLNRTVSSEEAMKEIEQRGTRPAMLEELLAFRTTYLDVHYKHPIIALGSFVVLSGDRYVPILLPDDAEYEFQLYEWDSLWSDKYQFLVVRN